MYDRDRFLARPVVGALARAAVRLAFLAIALLASPCGAQIIAADGSGGYNINAAGYFAHVNACGMLDTYSVGGDNLFAPGTQFLFDYSLRPNVPGVVDPDPGGHAVPQVPWYVAAGSGYVSGTNDDTLSVDLYYPGSISGLAGIPVLQVQYVAGPQTLQVQIEIVPYSAFGGLPQPACDVGWAVNPATVLQVEDAVGPTLGLWRLGGSGLTRTLPLANEYEFQYATPGNPYYGGPPATAGVPGYYLASMAAPPYSSSRYNIYTLLHGGTVGVQYQLNDPFNGNPGENFTARAVSSGRGPTSTPVVSYWTRAQLSTPTPTSYVEFDFTAGGTVGAAMHACPSFRVVNASNPLYTGPKAATTGLGMYAAGTDVDVQLSFYYNYPTAATYPNGYQIPNGTAFTLSYQIFDYWDNAVPATASPVQVGTVTSNELNAYYNASGRQANDPSNPYTMTITLPTDTLHLGTGYYHAVFTLSGPSGWLASQNDTVFGCYTYSGMPLPVPNDELAAGQSMESTYIDAVLGLTSVRAENGSRTSPPSFDVSPGEIAQGYGNDVQPFFKLFGVDYYTGTAYPNIQSSYTTGGVQEAVAYMWDLFSPMAPAKPTQWVEVDNEPSAPFSSGSGTYLADLDQAYSLSATNSPSQGYQPWMILGPGMVNLGSSVSSPPTSYLQQMAAFFSAQDANGTYGCQLVDAVSFHGYPAGFDSWEENGVFEQVGMLRSLMSSMSWTGPDRHGVSIQNKQIWQTEVGWPYGLSVGMPKTQGDFLVRMLALGDAAGIPPQHNHYYYTTPRGYLPVWLDDTTVPAPNRAGMAARIFAEQTASYRASQPAAPAEAYPPVIIPTGKYMHALDYIDSGGNNTVMIWGDDFLDPGSGPPYTTVPKTTQVTLPEAPTSVVNLMGQPVAGYGWNAATSAATVPVTASPIYVKCGPGTVSVTGDTYPSLTETNWSVQSNGGVAAATSYLNPTTRSAINSNYPALALPPVNSYPASNANDGTWQYDGFQSPYLIWFPGNVLYPPGNPPAKGQQAQPQVLTINFTDAAGKPTTHTIDTVAAVTTAAVGNTAGVRNYEVDVQSGGQWTPVSVDPLTGLTGEVVNNVNEWVFYNRFAPIANASAVRLQIFDINNGAWQNDTAFYENMDGATRYTFSGQLPGVCELEAYGSPDAITISPTSASSGSAGFTLTITGAGFVSPSVVYWTSGGSTTTLTPTSVTPTTIQVPVPPSLLVSAGTASVSVAGVAGTSTTNATNPASFAIVHNPAPTISSISPSRVVPGAPAFTLTIGGTGFVAGSTVRWSGSPLATTYVSATELTAAVPASAVASSGSGLVSVTSPAPGGGTSSTTTLAIAGPAYLSGSITSLYRDPATNAIVGVVTVTNNGGAAVSNVCLGTATLKYGSTSVGAVTPLPAAVNSGSGTIPAWGSTTVMFQFPPTAVKPGTRFTVTAAITSNGLQQFQASRLGGSM